MTPRLIKILEEQLVAKAVNLLKHAGPCTVAIPDTELIITIGTDPREDIKAGLDREEGMEVAILQLREQLYGD